MRRGSGSRGRASFRVPRRRVRFHRAARRILDFFVNHPGDGPIEIGGLNTDQVRVPADQVLHIFRATRPGQVRGVPLVTAALVSCADRRHSRATRLRPPAPRHSTRSRTGKPRSSEARGR
ncbi:phage portal protein [Bradyrhizobium sp. USDA 3256]